MNANPTPRLQSRKYLPGFKKLGRYWLILLLLLVLASWLALRLTILADLPSVDDLDARLVRPTTRILDRNGRLLYEVLDPNAGKQISLAADSSAASRYGVAGVPDACVQATLATEDSRFFFHPGVDPIAIARAFWQNWRAGSVIVSGASTLTQQLARSLLMEPAERYDRSYQRKLREAYLALQIEWRYSKAEILRLYLNQTYYGNFAFGLEAAAQNYFAKPAAQLSRAECALLTGLIQYPVGYNPFVDPESAKNRQLTVLRLMVGDGFVTQAEADQMAAEPLRYRSSLFSIEAPHFVMYVQDQLLRQVGVERLRAGGLEVRTSLDLGLQRQAQAAVRRRLEQLNCRPQGQTSITNLAGCDSSVDGKTPVVARNAAVVVLDVATGEILAMVGSPNYFDAAIQGNVNAALSQRQPGSAIKPLTYAAALDPGWSAQAGAAPLTAATILPDLPTAFPGGRGEELAASGSFGDSGAYRPENYDLRYHGPVSVREALANSYNIPAVLVLQRIGVPTLQRIASAAGIGSFTGQYGLALTLGGGEVSLLDLTTAYGIFPRGGQRLGVQGILGIGDRGLVTGESPIPDSRSPIISPEAAFLVTDILTDPIARLAAFGENSVVTLPFPAAAKTGTTTDWRDNWTVGFSATRLVGVWVGNADNKPMVGVTGIDGAGPIWRDVMLAAHPTPPPDFVRPLGIKAVTVCAPSGLLPTPECPRLRREYFIPGTEPTRPDDQFVRVAIDRATGQPASADTPTARIVERTYWNLGPAYADWAAAQGISQLPSSAVQPTAPGATDSPIHNSQFTIRHSLFLNSPTPNSAYAIHPGVPAERQRLPVTGHTGSGVWHSLRLLVDGEMLAQAENAAAIQSWWQLTPGAHRFWIEGERTENGPTEYTEPITIVVE